MKKITLVAIVAVLLLGCKKERRVRFLINNTWALESVKNVDSVVKDTPPYVFILLFEEMIDRDEFCFYKPGNNISDAYVSGNVKIGNNRIKFNVDDFNVGSRQFAQSWGEVFDNINLYETDGYNLVLKGKNGEIINLTKRSIL